MHLPVTSEAVFTFIRTNMMKNGDEEREEKQIGKFVVDIVVIFLSPFFFFTTLTQMRTLKGYRVVHIYLWQFLFNHHRIRRKGRETPNETLHCNRMIASFLFELLLLPISFFSLSVRYYRLIKLPSLHLPYT